MVICLHLATAVCGSKEPDLLRVYFLFEVLNIADGDIKGPERTVDTPPDPHQQHIT